MNIKSLIFTLLSVFVLHIQAQNQTVTHSCHTTFSGESQTAIPQDWIFDGSSHQFAVDSFVRNESGALKIYGVNDSISPSVLTLTVLPVNDENRVTFSMKVKTLSEADSLLMVVSAMDTMAVQWVEGSADWKDYSVSIPLSGSSQMMIPQIMFPGTGPYWISETTVEMTKKTYPAEIDHEFDAGSAISSIPTDRNSVDRLALLCKIWGFLKYYHPMVCDGRYNWDYELFRWLPDVLKCRSEKEVCEFVLDKVSAMGTFDEGTSGFPACDSMYYSVPSFRWLDEISRINRPLYDLLNSIKLADRSRTAYYYGKGTNSMNSFPTEAGYGNNIYPDAGFRLLALYRYWNIIEYFYPYRKNVTDKTWDNVLYKFIPLFVNAKNAEEYRSAIDCMGTYLKDNHTSCHYSDSILPSEKRRYYLPVFWDFVEDKLTVTDDFAGQSSLKKGDVICGINGVGVDELVGHYAGIISASNEWSLLYAVSLELIQQKDSVVDLCVRRNNKKMNISISGLTSEKYFRSKAESTADVPYYKWLSDSVGYFTPISPYSIDSLSTVMNEFKDAKAIVIDMRNYPCDLLYHIADYLLPHPVGCTRTTSVVQDFPGVVKWDDVQYFGNENPDYYKGKIVVLVNEKTVSMGESIVAILSHCPDAVIVGSPTAGSDGPISTFVLPGAVYVRFTGKGFYFADKKAIQNVGIIPDVNVCVTRKGVESSIDELLQKAVDIVK